MNNSTNNNNNNNNNKRIINLSSIIENQGTIGLGVVGNTANGKSTTVYKLTGKKTQTSSSELQRNITIDIGYANIRIYRDTETGELVNSSIKLTDPKFKLLRHISLIDCPGHQAYMINMISGSNAFDAALMLFSGSETIPQPQTVSHSEILRLIKMKNVLLLLNKIDLMHTDELIDTRLNELFDFLNKKENKHLREKQIQPISAQNGVNIDKILKYLIELPNTNLFESVNNTFGMNILRSFSVNKNNISIDDMTGGVVGGSISNGYVAINDWIIIKPGIIKKKDSEWICTPIISQVKSIKSCENNLDIAVQGGLIAIGLDCDPTICRNNNLLGNNIYKFNKTTFEDIKTNNIVTKLSIEINYFDFAKNNSEYTNLTNINLLVNGKLIKATITKSIKDSERFDMCVESPIIFEKNQTFPIINKSDSEIKLFAVGKMKKIIQCVTMILPSNIDSIIDELNENDDIIEIIDDVNEAVEESVKVIVKESDETRKANIKTEILKHKINQINYKPKPLTCEFNLDNAQKIIWENAKTFIDEYDLDRSKKLEVKIDASNIKWISFGQVIIKHLDYVYSKDNQKNITQLNSDESVLLLVKRHNSKSIESAITMFIKEYFKCSHCTKLTKRFGKVLNTVYSICVICNDRHQSEKHFQ